MNFWGGLGQGIATYGASRLRRTPAGIFMRPQSGLNIPMDRQIATQAVSGGNIAGAAQGADLGAFTPPSGVDLSQENPEAMAGGKIVTKPTLAMVGDSGPEAVIPMNPKPGAKTSPGMLGERARFQHVRGPQALKNVSPIRTDLPLRPNVIVR